MLRIFSDIDRGFLFTLKELFTRPGQSIREYLEGKRINYINSITFILLVVGLGYYLAEFSHVKIADLTPENSKKLVNEISELSKKYPKISAFISVPFYSVFSYIFFRKSKFNLTEHLILNTYVTAGTFVLSTIFTIISIFYPNQSVLQIILWLLQLANFLYLLWAYYGFFKPDGYTKRGLILRSVASYFSVQIFFMLVGVVIGIASKILQK